ncbi:PRC-barrel domain-containing protein [Bradyrhizobium sp.]|uniref:PRC-barrel domain-containing protein n=1 Tax=Bradyrhizobium sp. TaxID=376 RepID=UPI003C56BBEF
MKNIGILVGAIIWSLVPAITQAAQPWETTDRTGDLQQTDKIPVIAAKDIVGKSIADRNGNAAGRVASLIVDSAGGKIKYVLIEGSPNFDLGGYLVAVPWPSLTFGLDGRTIAVNVTADELRHAPLIDRSLIYQMVASSTQTRRYGYWGYPRGVDPYGYADLGPGDPYRPGFLPVPGGCAGLSTPAGAMTERTQCDRLTELERQTGDPPQAIRTDHPAQEQSSLKLDRQPPDRRETYSDQNSGLAGDNSAVATDQSGNGQRAHEDHRSDSAGSLTIDQNAVVSALRAPTTTSTSGLTSARVYSENGSLIGQIDQVVIDLDRGDIAYVGLERRQHSGHHLTRLAIPIRALTWSTHDSGDDRLTVSELLLRNTPALEAGGTSRSRFVSKQNLAELYAHFDLAPYWRRPRDG